MRQTRGRWLDLFADYNARIEIVYLEPPFESLLRQNKARSKAVPEQVDPQIGREMRAADVDGVS